MNFNVELENVVQRLGLSAPVEYIKAPEVSPVTFFMTENARTRIRRVCILKCRTDLHGEFARHRCMQIKESSIEQGYAVAKALRVGFEVFAWEPGSESLYVWKILADDGTESMTIPRAQLRWTNKSQGGGGQIQRYMIDLPRDLAWRVSDSEFNAHGQPHRSIA